MSVRTVHLASGHLEAEMASYPLASVSAFELALTRLDPGVKENTAKLWRAAETELLAKNPALSIEEGVVLRDHFWFSQHGQPRRRPWSMLDWLRGLAAKFTLDPEQPQHQLDRVCRAQLDPDRLRVKYRWLGFSMPAHLIDSLNANPPRSSHDAVCAPFLDRCPSDFGFGQVHLHLNAATSFLEAWGGLLSNLAIQGGPASRTLTADQFRSPGAIFAQGGSFGSWLVRTALVRHAQAEFLRTRTSVGFREFWDGWFGEAASTFGTISAGDPLSDLLGGAFRGEEGFETLRQIFAHAIHERGLYTPGRDPLAAFYPGFEHADVGYFNEGCRRLGSGREDPVFETAFWQVSRMETLFYRHLVQRPLIPGLQWFVRFFKRIEPTRIPDIAERVVRAARLDGLGRGLRSLEVRVGPDSDASGMYAYLQQIIEGFRRVEQEARQLHGGSDAARSPDDRFRSTERTETHVPECGIVLHFSKNRGGGFFDGQPAAFWSDTEAAPLSPLVPDSLPGPHQARYARYFRTLARQARALGQVLLERPALLFAVRGIDVCTDEAGVPTWVVAPLLRYVVEAAEIARRSRVETRGLRFHRTVHCGEEWIHLASGLRRIDEARRFCGFREGDRIGHGLALGVQPALWATARESVVMAKEERLLDLTWELFISGCAPANCLPAARHAYLIRCALELAADIFQQRVTLEELVEWYQALHSEDRLVDAGFPDCAICAPRPRCFQSSRTIPLRPRGF